MEVLRLMNSNPNWRDVLSADPYNITIKEDGEFVLLKYSQIDSDFNLPIVRECRGAIFTYEEKYDTWICVRRAFDKFGNYGESYAAEIDWSTASVQEKIDGSLMSVWNYKGEWHLSTNGTIDAFKAPLGDIGLTFGDYFIEALGCSWESFTEQLLTSCCYTYELVGPLNRVVISYPRAELYAIGQREMICWTEVEYDGPLGAEYNIFLPKLYNLYNLDEVIKIAEHLSKDEEGFVVCDAQFNRIKVKFPEYLMAARLHNNGVITKKRLVEIVLTEKVDDFIAYCPAYEARLLHIEDEIKQIMRGIASELDWVEDNHYFSLARADYAKAIKGLKYKHFLFAAYDGKFTNIKEYLYSLRPEKIEKMITAL